MTIDFTQLEDDLNDAWYIAASNWDLFTENKETITLDDAIMYGAMMYAFGQYAERTENNGTDQLDIQAV